MKISTRILAATAGALGILVTAQVSAQSPAGRARIPFAFTASDKTLPAGVYDVERVGSHREVLLLRGDRGGVAFMGSSRVSNSAEKSRLVFRRYGDSYFLHEVWIGGGRRIGYTVPESKTERALRAGARGVNAQAVQVLVTVG